MQGCQQDNTTAQLYVYPVDYYDGAICRPWSSAKACAFTVGSGERCCLCMQRDRVQVSDGDV
jgi:hypothetical protein